MSEYLVGMTIEEIKIADDKKAIMFITEKENVIARCDGDCCSSTWIEHITLPAMGFPCLVINMEGLEMPEDEKTDDYEVIAFYGLKIGTDKGDMIIDYRNESNGYYGGNLSWPDDDYFYGGVYGQNVSSENWIDLNEDI